MKLQLDRNTDEIRKAIVKTNQRKSGGYHPLGSTVIREINWT